MEIKGTVVIANVFGFTIDDYLEVIRILNDAPGIAMYELNASCPNTEPRRHGLRNRSATALGVGGSVQGSRASDH